MSHKEISIYLAIPAPLVLGPFRPVGAGVEGLKHGWHWFQFRSDDLKDVFSTKVKVPTGHIDMGIGEIVARVGSEWQRSCASGAKKRECFGSSA